MHKLSEIKIFKDFQDQEIEDILALSKAKEFSQGDAVVRQGEVGNSLFIIEEGSLDISVERQGSPLVVNTVSACTVVGEKAFIDAETRAASVIARSPVKAHELAWADFSKMLEEGSPLAGRLLFNIAQLMAQRMKILLDKFTHLNSGNINSREMEQFRNKVFTEWNF